MKKLILNLFILIFASCFQSTVCGQNLDVELLQKINSNNSEFLRNYSTVISNTTTYVSLSMPAAEAIIGLIEHNNDNLQNALYLSCNFGINAVMSFSLKRIVNRPRPAELYPDLIIPYQDLTRHSFPSGHTSEAFSSATAISLLHPKWYVIVPSFLWAGSVGYSRMNLGVHYPSDVLAGAILGSGTALLTFKINKWLQQKKVKKNVVAEFYF